MPQALGAIALALFQAGGPIWLSNALVGVGALGAIGGAIGQIALSFGISALAGALFKPRQQSTKPEDVQQSVRIAASDRVKIYGQFQATGNWIFGDSVKGDLHKVLAVCEGLLVTVLNLKVDDTVVTTDANGLVQQSPYNGKVGFRYRRGLPVETYYSELRVAFPEWTTEHRGDGVVTIYATQYAVSAEDTTKLFPSLKDTLFRIEGRFTEVWNPVTGVTAWSDNAAAVIRDFMVSRHGLRIPSSIVNTPMAIQAWRDAFNRAGRGVPLKAGGEEPAYRLWGAYKLAETPGSVLEQMLFSCDAMPILTRDGGVAIRIGDTPAPTVTLDASNITAAVKVTGGLDVRTTANRINSKFLSAPDDYLLIDADPWMNEDSVTERGEIIDLADFAWSPSHAQCRRLMKLRYHRLTPRWVVTFNCRLGAIGAFQEQFVNVDYTIGPMRIVGVFEVQEFTWNMGDNGILRSFTISLQSIADGMYSWDPATEEGTAPVTKDVVVNRTIPGLTGFNVTVGRRDIFSGQSVAYAILSYPAPTGVDGILSLTPEFQYKKVSETDWQNINMPEKQYRVDGPILDDGVEYEFRARNKSLRGSQSEWTNPTIKITALADNTPPALVTNVNKTGGAGKVDLFWRTPNSPNFSRVVIRRNTTNNFSTATIVGTVYGSPNVDYTVTDSGLAAGTYYYWLTSVNGSNFPVNAASQAVATGSVVVT